MERDRVYLLDILHAARLAVSYVESLSQCAFLEDIQRQDAVIRRIEIIGEAARRITDETRAAHPEIPWQAMIGMRNLMIHAYDDVDLLVVWKTVEQSLPELIARIAPLFPAE